MNGGFSLVEFIDESGVPFPWRPFEMRTECIPYELRPLGSRFLFQWEGIWPDDSDTVEALRERCKTNGRVLRSA